MKLYAAAGASAWTARPRLAVYARGLDIEVCSVPGGTTTSAEYLAINPLGKVPALLLDDGRVIIESEVIVEFLEDRFDQSPLRPASAEDRASARVIARLCDLYLLEAGRPLLTQIDPATRNLTIVDQTFADLDRELSHLERFMDSGPFAVGKTMSTADCALAPSLAVIHGFGMHFGRAPFANHPRLAEYMSFIATNPHVARVLGEMRDGIAIRISAG